MRLVRGHLVACALLLQALSARAQDAVPTPGTQPEDPTDDRLVLNVRGHAETQASGVVLEFIIRGQADNADDARTNYEKKVRKLLKGVPDAAPVTTAVSVDLTADRKVQANGIVFKLNPNGQNGTAVESGATFSGRFSIAVRNLGGVEPPLARRRVAQVLDKLAENEITGAEDDVDIMYVHLETDQDALRERAYAQAIGDARKRAALLARLSDRKLGKMTIVREAGYGSNADQAEFIQSYYNFVYPSSTNGWKVATIVKLDVDLVVSFELE